VRILPTCSRPVGDGAKRVTVLMPRALAESARHGEASGQLPQRRRIEVVQFVGAGITHLLGPQRIGQQRPANRNQVELAALHARDQPVEARRLRAFAKRQRPYLAARNLGEGGHAEAEDEGHHH